MFVVDMLEEWLVQYQLGTVQDPLLGLLLHHW